MAMQGETIHLGANPNCPNCGKFLKEEVRMSTAGYCIGTSCCCGPYSRESLYYKTREEAQHALDTNSVAYRTSNYRGN